MRFASTLQDETLDALAARVYDVGKEPSASIMRTARRELTDANPYLKTIDRVPAGTVVAVPEIDGAPFGEQTREADSAAVSVAGGQLAGLVGTMRTTIAAELEAQAADARDAAAFLRSAEAKQLARADDRLKEALPAMLKVAAARVDDAQTLQRHTKDAFAQLETDLADLMQAFG